MAKAKAPHVNKAFDEEVRIKAFALIRAGEVFEGRFWKNRSNSARRLGYRSWEDVPERIRECINQINRAASIKGKAHARDLRMMQAEQSADINHVPQAAFVVTNEVLEEILEGTLLVPHTATPEQIRQIREYVTIKNGFDPKRLLLGLASRMEPA